MSTLMNLLPKLSMICLAVSIMGFSAPMADADLIDDFTGLEVALSATTTSVGGKDFDVTVLGSNTATVGAGVEFVLSLTAGDFGGGSNQNFIDIDVDQNGVISATAHESFYYGAWYFNENPSFDLDITFTDPAVEIISANKSGILASGNHFVSGTNPITWSFSGTPGSGSSYQIGFYPSPFDVPKLELNASSVPEPAALPMIFGVLACCVARFRRISKARIIVK